MKVRIWKWIDIFAESINYIIINYALSNVEMLFWNHLLFILFSASKVWTMCNYWRKINEISKNKIVSTILLIICFISHIGLVYFVGRIVGDILPFKQ